MPSPGRPRGRGRVSGGSDTAAGLRCPFCDAELHSGMNECDCGRYWLGHRRDMPILTNDAGQYIWDGASWQEPRYRA